MDKSGQNILRNNNHYLHRTLLNLFFLLTFLLSIAINLVEYYQILKFKVIIPIDIVILLIIFIGAFALNRQLSRQIAIENKLRKSEALLKGIIDGSNDFIAALDLDYRFIVFNRSYRDEFNRIFGKEITLGMSIKDALAHLPEEQKKAVDIWKKSLNGEEFIVISKFGDKKLDQLPYEITCSSIRDDRGNLIGASHIVRNIQKRVETEKAILTANEKLTLAYQALKTHDEGVSLLNQMDALLQTCSTVNEALELTVSYCKKLLPFTGGIIYLTHSSGNYLVSSAHWDTTKNNKEIFSTDQCWALRQGKTYRFFNKENNIRCKHYITDDQLQLCFCVPLLAQNDNIGLLYIEIKKASCQTKEQLNEIADGHELIINNLAGLIALSIANIRLKDTLRIRSIRDPLTKVYNRAYLNESLEREIHRAERSKTGLAIMMIDIDHFKNINDKFGHQTGDLVLQTIGNLLLKQVRKSDIACRYGGEEFLLMFYDFSLKDAVERAEQIRKKISRIKLNFSDKIIHSITASFGIAMYPEHGEDMEKLIRASDQALYESKKMGRDKVTVFQKQS